MILHLPSFFHWVLWQYLFCIYDNKIIKIMKVFDFFELLTFEPPEILDFWLQTVTQTNRQTLENFINRFKKNALTQLTFELEKCSFFWMGQNFARNWLVPWSGCYSGTYVHSPASYIDKDSYKLSVTSEPSVGGGRVNPNSDIVLELFMLDVATKHIGLEM